MVWLWKCGLRMNTREHQLDAAHDIVGGDVLGFFVADELAEAADALGQRGAEARLVGAAVGGRDGVAIIGFAAVRIERPGDRPFGAALIVGEVLLADERLIGDGRALAELVGEMVGEAAGELEDRVFGDFRRGQRGIAAPADLDPGEEIGLGPGEGVEARRVERRVGAENLRVGGEGDGGAAAVGGGADLLQLGDGEALARTPGGRASSRAPPRRWSRSTAR